MNFKCLICGQVSEIHKVDETTKVWYDEGCTTLSEAIKMDMVNGFAYRCPCCNSEVVDNKFKLVVE